MPFRPAPILPSKKNLDPLPLFRVGVTETRAPTELNGRTYTGGAAGTMAIPLIPGISRIYRLRIAGQKNEGEIYVTLYKGGWDPGARKHISKDDTASKLVEDCIEDKGAYDKTYDIQDGDLDVQCSTLSIDIRSTADCAISLIAVEIS